MTRYAKIFISAFLLLRVFFAFGQATAHPEGVGLVNYEANTIRFFGQTPGFPHFYAKLDTLIRFGKGKVRIMQIGGSHVQAEYWTDRLRDHFIQLANGQNGGRGFVFPFKLAETWNPKNRQISYTGTWKAFRNSVKKHQADWGVSGITVTTADSSATFQIAYRDTVLTNYKFNRIRIFHEMNPENYRLKLLSEKPVSTVRNDSVGYTEFLLKKPTDTLSVGLVKTDSLQNHFTMYGLSLENNDPGIVFTAIGVNGAKTSSFIRNKLFVNQLQAVKPDLVIFSIGINDAYYAQFCPSCYFENYEKLIEWIRSVNPDAEFLFVSNNDSYYKRKYPNKRVFKAREVMISLAKKYHAGFWDLFEVMGGLGSIRKWELAGLAKKDKIHFTEQGYELIGDLMFEAIEHDFQSFKTRNDAR